MYKYFLLVFFILFSENFLYAQNKVRTLHNTYKVWVDTGKGTKRAYLATISDSAIYTSENRVSFTSDMANTALYTPIYYTSIVRVRVVRKGSAAKGFRTGLLIGATSGALIGLASGDDRNNCFICFTAGEKALLNGVFLGAIGGVAGAFIGLKERKFKINRQKSNFDGFKQYMQTWLIDSNIKKNGKQITQVKN